MRLDEFKFQASQVFSYFLIPFNSWLTKLTEQVINGIGNLPNFTDHLHA
jgi:hypothetical protein